MAGIDGQPDEFSINKKTIQMQSDAKAIKPKKYINKCYTTFSL